MGSRSVPRRDRSSPCTFVVLGGSGRSGFSRAEKAIALPARFTRIDAWIIAGILALLAVLGVAVPSEELRPIEPAEIRSSAAWYLVLCVLGIGISVGTRLMQEAIVRRRQSFDSIDETQADDALRSASIQGLAGVGYGGPMFIAAVMAWDLAFSTEDPVSGLFDRAVVLAIAGFGMLIGFPRFNHRWIVRRAREA